MKLVQLFESPELFYHKSGTFSMRDGGTTKILKEIPVGILGDFYCNNSVLTEFPVNFPRIVLNFFCSDNYLTSLKGAPEIIRGNFHSNNNHLTSLQDIHRHIKEIGHSTGAGGSASFGRNPIKSHVLGLLKIKNLIQVALDNQVVDHIINSHLMGDRDIFTCQEELEDAGFEEYAKL